MLCCRINRNWLNIFDSVGKPLVDLYASYVQKTMSRISAKRFSTPGLLNIAMVTLIIMKIFLIALFKRA